MPVIPRYNRQQTIPGQVADAGVAGAHGQAWGQLGNAMDNSAKVLQDHVTKIQSQDNINEQILLGSKYDEELRIFKQEEQQKTGSDSFKNMDRGKKFKLAMIEKYGKLASNELVKNSLNKYISNSGEHLLDTLAVHQSQQRGIVTKQASDALLNGLLKDSYTGNDFKTLVTKWTNTLTQQHLSGAISEAEAITQVTAGESAIASSHLDGLIDRNPSKAIQEIEKGTYNPYLTADKLHTYHQKAISLENAMIKDAAKKKKEQKAQQAEALKKEQEKTGNDFLVKNLNGELTRQEVINSNLSLTGANSKSSWVKAISDREKKLKTKAVWKTKPEVLAAIQTAIVKDPESVTPTDIMELQGKDLSTADAKALVNFRKSLIDKAVDPLKTQEAKAAYTRLRSAKTDGLFDSDKGLNAKKWAEAVNLLTAFIKNHPNEDPQDFIDEVLAPAKDGWIRNLLNLDSYQSEEDRQAQLRKEAGLTSKQKEEASNKTDDKTKTKIYKRKDGTYYAVLPDGTKKTTTKQNGKWVY